MADQYAHFRALPFTVVIGEFNCFSCGAKGRGAIDLVKLVRGIGFQQAVEFLEGIKPPPCQCYCCCYRGRRKSQVHRRTAYDIYLTEGEYLSPLVDCPPAENFIKGADVSFRYKLLDIRSLDGERLLDSGEVGDNVIAILARLRDRKEAVRRIVARIAELRPAERLRQLLILAGLRRLEEFVEREARTMPILNDILENKVLGREFKRGLNEGREEGRLEGRQQGELTLLRRQIEKRFGAVPLWAEEQLSKRSTTELEELSVKLLDAASLEDLFA